MNAVRLFFLRIYAVAFKEALHVRRDVQTMIMALVMPLILLLLFGFGVSFDLDHLAISVADQDHTPASRAIAHAVETSSDLRLVGGLDSAADAEDAFHRGAAVGVLVIPRGFAIKLARGEPSDLQLLVAGSDGATAMQVLAKTDAVVAASAARFAPPGASVSLPVSVASYIRYNPEGRSALMIVPGLVAYILAIIAVLLTALAIAREWERGSMEQLFCTPVGRLEIVIGKLLPYLVLGAIAVLLVLATGAWVFDVPFRGNLWTLAAAAVLFLIGMLGQGLVISVLARNQMIATQAGVLSSMLPSMLLSGFLFPVENLPTPLRIFSNLVPARHFIAALRGVLLRGNGFDELGGELLALAAFALTMLVIAAARFRRRLD
jgi:ABC-2 type transport system permease protein